MNTEKFYDPEDVARSWSEINLTHAAAPANTNHLLRWALPRLMAYYSQELWCAGWLDTAHEVLPDMFPEIGEIAATLGEICTYWDGSDSGEIEWEKFRPR
jgi:hypothetical protein